MLIDIGIFSLHSIQRAIWSGVETTFWGIKETHTGAFQLLNDSLAHREDFEVVTSSNKYLLYFLLQGVAKARYWLVNY